LKILVLCSTLDLSKPFGATPALWQLFKGFYEEGHELFIIPYHGREINSLWWKCYRNPNYYKGVFLEKFTTFFKSSKKKKNSSLIPMFARTFAKPNFEKSIIKILKTEKEIEVVILIGVPLNQLNGLPTRIRKFQKIPIIYYDLDVPTALPSHGGFSFNYYVGADLAEYDSFLIPSEGSLPELKELGANNINIVHFGVDPDVYSGAPVQKDIDLFFFGNGGAARANNIKMMITEPSRVLKNTFVVSGRDLDVDLGNAKILSPLSFIEWRKYCLRAKINLNVVRELHASFRATSTSRPFELAALKCCVVSAPYDGLEKWFKIGTEMLIGHSSQECIELYETLLEDQETRNKIGQLAHDRVLKEHTSRHRVKQIIEIIKKL